MPMMRFVPPSSRASTTPPTRADDSLDGEDLADWLADVRSAARARPIEAQLSRGPDGFRGSLVLQLGAGS